MNKQEAMQELTKEVTELKKNSIELHELLQQAKDFLAGVREKDGNRLV